MAREYHSYISRTKNTNYGDMSYVSLTVPVTIITVILGYFFSVWYLNAYYLGDQLHYARFYDALYDAPPSHWAQIQKSYLGSSEPFYRYIIGIASFAGIERIPYLSMWNAILTGSLGYICTKFRCSLIFSIFLFTNYYLLVILGPAERLKFAYIMLVLAFSVDSVKMKYVLSLSSIFFHAQAVVQFVASAGFYITERRALIFKSPARAIIFSVLSLLFLGGTGYLFIDSLGNFIFSKSQIYYQRSDGITELIQWAMVLVGGVLVFRSKLAYLVGMIPMGVLTALFGNRINIATLAFFAAMAITQRKTSNPLVLVVMGYMSFKSIGFLADVISYGTGYGN